MNNETELAFGRFYMALADAVSNNKMSFENSGSNPGNVIEELEEVLGVPKSKKKTPAEKKMLDLDELKREFFSPKNSQYEGIEYGEPNRLIETLVEIYNSGQCLSNKQLVLVCKEKYNRMHNPIKDIGKDFEFLRSYFKIEIKDK